MAFAWHRSRTFRIFLQRNASLRYVMHDVKRLDQVMNDNTSKNQSALLDEEHSLYGRKMTDILAGVEPTQTLKTTACPNVPSFSYHPPGMR